MLIAGCGLLLILQCTLLVHLPYTTTQLRDVIEMPEVDTATARDARFDPFRAYFAHWCRDTTGLTAAECLSDRMAQQFPHGTPSDDLFYASYDPARSLAAHAAGEPGHCVTRSGLVVTALLSVGIPARVVSLMADDGTGHNIVSVWDDEHGWVVVDPTMGKVLLLDGKPAVETRLHNAPDHITTLRLTAPAGIGDVHVDYRTLFVHVLYPEPWYYLRVGPHQSIWPFRGVVYRLGPATWALGGGQMALHWGVMATVGLLCFVLFYRQASR